MTPEEFNKLTDDQGFVEIAPGEYAKTNRTNPRLSYAQPERDMPLALGSAISGEKESVGKIIVSFTLFRVKPLDPDNACGGTKGLIDGLCKIGLLPGDEAQLIALRVDQERVRSPKDEKTVIKITYPDENITFKSNVKPRRVPLRRTLRDDRDRLL